MLPTVGKKLLPAVWFPPEINIKIITDAVSNRLGHKVNQGGGDDTGATLLTDNTQGPGRVLEQVVQSPKILRSAFLLLTLKGVSEVLQCFSRANSGEIKAFLSVHLSF